MIGVRSCQEEPLLPVWRHLSRECAFLLPCGASWELGSGSAFTFKTGLRRRENRTEGKVKGLRSDAVAKRCLAGCVCVRDYLLLTDRGVLSTSSVLDLLTLSAQKRIHQVLTANQISFVIGQLKTRY